MASEHYRVSPRYWTGDRRTWPDREKLLGIYLLTCEHRSTEGLYRMPKGYIGTDLGWTPRQVEDALEHVIAAGFVRYDHDAEVVLLPNALKRQRPTTDNQIAGAVRKLALVPDNTLWDAFLTACDRHAPKLADAIRADQELHPNTHGNGHANGHGNTHDDAHASALRAGARALSSSSSISSSSLLPPSPPRGKRQRDWDTYREDMTAFVAEHLSGEDAEAVEQYIRSLRNADISPTVAAIRAMVDHNREAAAA